MRKLGQQVHEYIAQWLERLIADPQVPVAIDVATMRWRKPACALEKPISNKNCLPIFCGWSWNLAHPFDKTEYLPFRRKNMLTRPGLEPGISGSGGGRLIH